jgi:hypothetical protein
LAPCREFGPGEVTAIEIEQIECHQDSFPRRPLPAPAASDC